MSRAALLLALSLALAAPAAAQTEKSLIVSTAVNCNSTDTSLLAADQSRDFVLIINDSDTNVYLAFGVTAVAHTGALLVANGGGLLLDAKVTTQAIRCITLSGNSKKILLNIGHKQP